MNIWRRLGFMDFQHFVDWCPGCFGIIVGSVATAIIMGAGFGLAWWLFR